MWPLKKSYILFGINLKIVDFQKVHAEKSHNKLGASVFWPKYTKCLIRRWEGRGFVPIFIQLQSKALNLIRMKL